MRIRRALLIAASLAPLAVGTALAQGAPDPFGPTPQQHAPANDPFGPRAGQPRPAEPFGAPPPAQALGASPFGAPQQQQQQVPPCLTQFFKLRDDAQKKAHAIQLASAHKATPKEACHLFTVFSAAESKMLKYAVDNKSSCNVPDEVITQIKTGHTRTSELRTKICKVAEAPPRPAGPSLSDALGAPIPGANNIRSGGGGTFDTLTGNPVGR
jgi:hypothetical protein